MSKTQNPQRAVATNSNDRAEDPGGDHLDALLCAIQAAWAWRSRTRGYGAPTFVNPLEGWIADKS